MFCLIHNFNNQYNHRGYFKKNFRSKEYGRQKTLHLVSLHYWELESMLIFLYIYYFSPLEMRLVWSLHSYSASLINVCVGLVACCPVFNLSVSWVRAQIKNVPLMSLWLNLLNKSLHLKWGLIRSGPHKHTHDEHSLLLPCFLWSFAHSWLQKQNTFFLAFAFS